MNIENFVNMLEDYHTKDAKKLKEKHSVSTLKEFVNYYDLLVANKLDILDFHGNNLVYNSKHTQSTILKGLNSSDVYKSQFSNVSEEIYSTLKIENIGSTRTEISDLIKGKVPETDDEKKLVGMIEGYQFICCNEISEENISKLYKIAIVPYLNKDLIVDTPHMYRNSQVYVGNNHQGIDGSLIESYMKKFMLFINLEDEIEVLDKACIIHFYFSYLHPYIDGNGRMSRLLHIWYLVYKGYDKTIQYAFSKYIEQTKSEYYKAFEVVESDAKVTGRIDVSKFIKYIYECVYTQMILDKPSMEYYLNLLKEGKITHKENKLWAFVLSNYNSDAFSTKQLEIDFKGASYETIRQFVRKFCSYSLLEEVVLGSRARYKVKK